jgi:hypothetical protein
MTQQYRHCALVLVVAFSLATPLKTQIRSDESDIPALANAVKAWEKQKGITLSTAARTGLITDYRDAIDWFRAQKNSPTRMELDRASDPAIRAYLDDIVDDETALNLTVHLAQELGQAGFGFPRRHSLGVVVITTHPAEALVSIDGDERSSAKRRLVTAGLHQLRATLQGYSDCVVSVDVKTGETPVECTLARSGTRSPGRN